MKLILGSSLVLVQNFLAVAVDFFQSALLSSNAAACRGICQGMGIAAPRQSHPEQPQPRDERELAADLAGAAVSVELGRMAYVAELDRLCEAWLSRHGRGTLRPEGAAS